MNQGRTSAFAIIVRMFVIVLVLTLGCSYFWNTLSGRNMFPFNVAILVAVILTGIFVVIGFVVVALGGNLLLGGDPDYERWKQQGGRPYLDSLPKPINPDSQETRGFSEPSDRP